ncbi:MAG TPA: hypothetical protein VFK80_11630 [Limnochordia bacterium]|nr:hypothetical protein [Limnochordia bacterium]
MLHETLAMARRVSPKAMRRNYLLGVGNGITFAISQAFYDPNTVLPVYLGLLGASNTLIGAMAAVTSAGWFLPQLFLASWYENSPDKLRFYRIASAIRVTMFFVFVATVFALAPRNPTLAATLGVLAMLICQLSGGMGGLAFNIVVAKTVPSHRRAGFYGTRQLWGGIGAFFAGLLVSYVLSAHSGLRFPFNFGVLYALGGLLLAVSLAQFALVHEPPDPPAPRLSSALAYWQAGARRLWADRGYRRFVVLRVVSGVQAMALPFYAAYLLRHAPVGAGFAGTLLSAQVVGSALSNMFWGRAGDRRGSRWNMVAANGLSIGISAVTLLGISLPAVSQDPVAARVWGCLLFAIIGAANSGKGIAFSTYLLDLAPAQHRVTYVSFGNTLAAVVGFMPIAGGLALDGIGFAPLVSLTLAAAAVATWLSGRLPADRPARGAGRAPGT